MAALWSGQAAATGYFEDGNTLLKVCTSTNTTDRSYCNGYVGGIVDSITEVGSMSGRKACLPAGVMSSQARDVVIQWLQRNPQVRHFTAPGLVAKALSEAFPCR